ncbi:deoxyuridine 5'-triphosphate nucleotidohydrolase [Hamiltosporidium tvaerminnensis]|uniref:Deoxyuridine 5'-triphosphate nucleotidohydrolase n=1 Tax=Hamiltosporidium tvaerminnensis TaxID=1176355 RepID=A0A4Q9KU75_9MICR|nr:deoxyuridine 5'-triphosphate nucleotidohydrolase [Hamiltosporidium tvaerminnensis]
MNVITTDNIKKNNTSYSLYSNNNYTLKPKTLQYIHTGVNISIPNNNFGLLTSTKYKIMGGVIDSDYRGEIVVMIYNIYDECICVSKGDEICRMYVVSICTPELVMVDELEESERGDKGGIKGLDQQEGNKGLYVIVDELEEGIKGLDQQEGNKGLYVIVGL